MTINTNRIFGLFLITGIITIFVWKRRKIVSYANKFLGETEIPGNLGFRSYWLQEKMKNVGWKKGQPWCMYLVKIIWLDKFPEIRDILDKLLSGSTQTSYQNVLKDNSGLFSINIYPSIGDIALFQYYDSDGFPTWSGHSGIVTKVNGSKYKDLEGNTNDSGGKEGYIIAAKSRDLSAYTKKKGLRLKGFIHYNYADV